MRLQDVPGYPLNMDYSILMNGEYSKEELNEWGIDLLAHEAKCWLQDDNEANQIFALAVVGCIRPLIEALTTTNIADCDDEITLIIIKTYLGLSQNITALRDIAIEKGLRSSSDD